MCGEFGEVSGIIDLFLAVCTLFEFTGHLVIIIWIEKFVWSLGRAHNKCDPDPEPAAACGQWPLAINIKQGKWGNMCWVVMVTELATTDKHSWVYFDWERNGPYPICIFLSDKLANHKRTAGHFNMVALLTPASRVHAAHSQGPVMNRPRALQLQRDIVGQVKVHHQKVRSTWTLDLRENPATWPMSAFWTTYDSLLVINIMVVVVVLEVFDKPSERKIKEAAGNG